MGFRGRMMEESGGCLDCRRKESPWTQKRQRGEEQVRGTSVGSMPFCFEVWRVWRHPAESRELVPGCWGTNWEESHRFRDRHNTGGQELTHWKRLWNWERLRAKEKGSRGGDGWMASQTQQTWVWASSGRQWRTRRPGMLQSMGSQRVGHDWATKSFTHSETYRKLK